MLLEGGASFSKFYFLLVFRFSFFQCIEFCYFLHIFRSQWSDWIANSFRISEMIILCARMGISNSDNCISTSCNAWSWSAEHQKRLQIFVKDVSSACSIVSSVVVVVVGGWFCLRLSGWLWCISVVSHPLISGIMYRRRPVPEDLLKFEPHSLRVWAQNFEKA